MSSLINDALNNWAQVFHLTGAMFWDTGYLECLFADCPSCKMRYDLAKGGCMHFRCPQCGHEFCSGCSEPFMQDGVCYGHSIYNTDREAYLP